MNKQKWLLHDPGNGRVAPLHEINTDQQLLFFVYFFSSPASQSFMISKKALGLQEMDALISVLIFLPICFFLYLLYLSGKSEMKMSEGWTGACHLGCNDLHCVFITEPCDYLSF